ncbi:MAG: hypothetical protein BWY74_03967 [Firmicutes bacterium ADurb.Bin419]|nr:MAG: hypothetical protein BWY74_03967 [Firmicutes bacterium ADurb.Bin419]
MVERSISVIVTFTSSLFLDLSNRTSVLSPEATTILVSTLSFVILDTLENSSAHLLPAKSGLFSEERSKQRTTDAEFNLTASKALFPKT